MSSPVPVAVALGSNLGDRQSHLEFACLQLSGLLSNLRVSSTRETVPIGVSGQQPLFLNAAIVGETTLEPGELLEALQHIEQARGRRRPFAGAARTLDLDLVLFGDRVIHETNLVLPHPRFRERLFVLEPLAEIAPGWRDPITLMTMWDLLGRLRQGRAEADQ